MAAFWGFLIFARLKVSDGGYLNFCLFDKMMISGP